MLQSAASFGLAASAPAPPSVASVQASGGVLVAVACARVDGAASRMPTTSARTLVASATTAISVSVRFMGALRTLRARSMVQRQSAACT